MISARLSPKADLLLHGVVEGWPQGVTTPAEVIALVRRSAPGTLLRTHVTLRELERIYAAVSGRAVSKRVRSVSNLARALHALPSKLKLLPFGAQGGWI